MISTKKIKMIFEMIDELESKKMSTHTQISTTKMRLLFVVCVRINSKINKAIKSRKSVGP